MKIIYIRNNTDNTYYQSILIMSITWFGILNNVIKGNENMTKKCHRMMHKICYALYKKGVELPHSYDVNMMTDGRYIVCALCWPSAHIIIHDEYCHTMMNIHASQPHKNHHVYLPTDVELNQLILDMINLIGGDLECDMNQLNIS